MKLTHFAGKITLMSVFALAIASCNKDKEAPTIEFHQPILDDMHYSQGTWFKVEAFIDDDAGLTNYKSYVTDSIGAYSLAINMSDTADVEGTGFIHRDSTILPFGAPGLYYYNIVAEDAEGNVTNASRRFFIDP